MRDIKPTDGTTSNGAKIYQDGSGTKFVKVDNNEGLCIFKQYNSDNAADTKQASIFCISDATHSAEMEIADNNGNGLSDGDSVKCSGKLSELDPDKISRALKQQNYKTGDTVDGTNLAELKSDNNSIKAEADKQYSLGSFMKMMNSTPQTPNNNNVVNINNNNLDPAKIAMYQNQVAMTAWNMDPVANGNALFDAMKYCLGMNGTQDVNNSSPTTPKSNLRFTDQADAAVTGDKKAGENPPCTPTSTPSSTPVNPEDNELAKLTISEHPEEDDRLANEANNGDAAWKKYEECLDTTKYKAKEYSGCSEIKIAQGDKSFKTKDGTEYKLVGVSQYTTPGKSEVSYTKVYESADGKRAVIKNSNESNRLTNSGKRNNDGFVRGVHRSVVFYNPADSKKDIDTEITANRTEAEYQKIQDDIGVNPPKPDAAKKSAETTKEKYALTIKSGDSIEDIKKRLAEANFDSDTIDKIIALITKDGVIEDGTINLKNINGAWQQE